ncbi:MAG: ABC transporter [Streptosporangiales bacterium]|nr:ABC transporter [Streptosporangiales bacterium]
MMLTSVLDRPVRGDLAARLNAVEQLVDFGEGRLDPKLLEDTRALLWRAGERLLLSGQHTVVALAGSTGSGKSSLFNTISGLELSPVGVRRPTTGATHACVWGLEGVGPLLDWLSIEKRHRYARASALDRDEGSLHGLVLLDLPDHDSIKYAHRLEVDRLVEVVDLLVWVVDPQKYADTVIHERYLRELAHHGDVMVVVLNQVDRLQPGDAEECATHLRELLATDGLHNARTLATSTVTGAGMDNLLKLLRETVATRQAFADRLGADVDQLVHRFEAACSLEVPLGLDHRERAAVVDALAVAAGGPALADAVEHTHQRHSQRYVDWPFLRLVGRVRRDPLRRLGEVREQLRNAPIDAIAAQQADVESALQGVTDSAARGLPEPWQQATQRAGLGHVDDVPLALGDALREAVPDTAEVPRWWHLVRLLQWLLAAAALAGLAWLAGLGLFAFLRVGELSQPLLTDRGLLPYPLALMGGCGLLGLITMVVCRRAAVTSARRRRQRAEASMRKRIEAVAKEKVFRPVDDELDRYTRFRDAVVVARGRR